MEAHQVDTLTPTEASEVLKIHEKTVIRLARANKIPGRKIGNQWRFSRRRLEELIEGARKKSA